MADQAPKPKEEFSFVWSAADVPVVFGDNLHWRTLGDRCYLTFGQLQLPMREGPLPPGTEIAIQPVARIVATPETVKLWAQLLAQAAREYEVSEKKK